MYERRIKLDKKDMAYIIQHLKLIQIGLGIIYDVYDVYFLKDHDVVPKWKCVVCKKELKFERLLCCPNCIDKMPQATNKYINEFIKINK